MTHTSCATHTQCNEPTQHHPIQETQMRPRHETQCTFTSIGPGDWSEKAHPSMTIDRCQTENDMRKSCKGTLTLYTEAPDPMEQATKCCHHGNKHKPPYEGPTMLLGMSRCTHLTQGSFTLPCIPFSSLSFL